MDIEKQQEIIMHRLKEFMKYEFNNDGLLNQLNKAGYDIDKRIDNVCNNLSEYMRNILIMMYKYNLNDNKYVLTKFKEKRIQFYIGKGKKKERLPYYTGYSPEIIEKYFRKFENIC